MYFTRYIGAEKLLRECIYIDISGVYLCVIFIVAFFGFWGAFGDIDNARE